jgi:MFS family permease
MCNNSYLVTVLESLVFVGSLIGFFVIPYIADNWGRKKGILISWTLCTVGILILSFAV